MTDKKKYPTEGLFDECYKEEFKYDDLEYDDTVVRIAHEMSVQINRDIMNDLLSGTADSLNNKK